MSQSRLTAALKALSDGFTIFPTEPGDKTPIRIYQDRSPEDAPWTIRWSEVATNDLDTVIRWWTHAPMANIGIACKPSGLLVVDCDQPKREWMLNDTPWSYLHEVFGPLVDGETLYDAVVQRYGGAGAVADAFDTYCVSTGSGGLHAYYAWPEGVQSTQDSIVKGLLDVRGNGGTKGGYVLGAGSATTKGSYDVVRHQRIRPAPPWLVELCRERAPYRAAPRRTNSDGTFKRPVNPNFAGLRRQVASAREGNRSNALYWAARAMCNDGAPQEECENLLVDAYLECGGDGGERQARQSIASAYRAQTRKMG